MCTLHITAALLSISAEAVQRNLVGDQNHDHATLTTAMHGAAATATSANGNCFGDLSRLTPLPSLRLVAAAGRSPVPFDSVVPGSTDAGQCIARAGVVRCLPHIVGIGVQKAGTGELLQYAHFTPQIKAARYGRRRRGRVWLIRVCPYRHPGTYRRYQLSCFETKTAMHHQNHPRSLRQGLSLWSVSACPLGCCLACRRQGRAALL